jgi:hypothetical protein
MQKISAGKFDDGDRVSPPSHWVSRQHRIADEVQPIKTVWREVLYHVSLYNPRRPAPVTGNLGWSASHGIARPRQILIAK